MPSSGWRGYSGAITGRICRTEDVVKRGAKARVADNLYYYNIFCRINHFFYRINRLDRRGMVPSAGGVVPACPKLPITRVAGRRPHACDITTRSSSLRTGGVRRRPALSAAGQNGPPHGEKVVINGQLSVKTIGCLTSEDLPVLLLLAVSRALPATRRRTGVTGYGRCAVGSPPAGSDPRSGVCSGQPQHQAKEYVRSHEPGDVVGLYKSDTTGWRRNGLNAWDS